MSVDGGKADLTTLSAGGCNCMGGSSSLASTLPSKYRQLPISEFIEPGPFVDRSAAHTASKVAGVSSWLFFLPRRVNSRAMRAGEMDDQLEFVAHAPMMR